MSTLILFVSETESLVVCLGLWLPKRQNGESGNRPVPGQNTGGTDAVADLARTLVQFIGGTQGQIASPTKSPGGDRSGNLDWR